MKTRTQLLEEMTADELVAHLNRWEDFLSQESVDEIETILESKCEICGGAGEVALDHEESKKCLCKS